MSHLLDLDADHSEFPISKSPNSNVPLPSPERALSFDGGPLYDDTSKPTYGPYSPTTFGLSPSRKLQEVFQAAGDRMDSSTRISSLVNTIEEEMLHSGVGVSLSKFKDHLLQLHEAGSDMSAKPEIEGDYLKVAVPPKPKLFPPPLGTQTRNWNSLFKAQAPSKSMKLVHYPDVQKGKKAHVNFDES